LDVLENVMELLVDFCDVKKRNVGHKKVTWAVSG